LKDGIYQNRIETTGISTYTTHFNRVRYAGIFADRRIVIFIVAKSVQISHFRHIIMKL